MSRHDPDLQGADAAPRLFCDLTQSWSEQGGGVRTYLLHKRRHIIEATPHRHVLIIPGARDEVIEEDLALCEFVDVSKHNVQEILREGIDLMLNS